MPRTDKKKNVGKVAEVVSEKPHATVREIAKETDLSVGAVYNSKKELEQSGTKDTTIQYIVKSSKENLKNISKANVAMTKAILNEFLETDVENDEYVLKEGKSYKEFTSIMSKITQIGKDDLQRITVLGGNVTNEEGGLNIQSLSDEQLLQLIKE